MAILDIVIQFGKFFSNGNSVETTWLDWFLKYFLAPFISFCIALYLYYLKRRDDDKKEEEKKEKMSNNDLEYFETVVENILEDISIQAEWYKFFAESIKAEPSKSHELKIVMIENLNRLLNKYDQQKIFHSYISQFRADQTPTATVCFMEIYKLLDLYLKTYHDAIEVNRKLNTELEKRLSTDYVGTFRSNFMPKFDRFYEELRVKKDLVLLTFINKTRDEFNLQEEKNAQVTQEHFINKILSKYDAIKKYSSGEELLFDCIILNSIYNNAVRSSIFQADKIIDLSEVIESIVEKIAIIEKGTDSLLKPK